MCELHPFQTGLLTLAGLTINTGQLSIFLYYHASLICYSCVIVMFFILYSIATYVGRGVAPAVLGSLGQSWI